MSDFEQTQIFPKTEQELGMEREEELLESELPKLREAAKSRNAKAEDITYRVLSTYSSLYFRASLIARLKLRGKQKYIVIPKRLKDVIPEDIQYVETASESQFLRIPYRAVSNERLHTLLEDATLLAVEMVPKEFDCCSRFAACSDAKVCVHPDPALSMLCGYRKILKSGRIFCGKNRNID